MFQGFYKDRVGSKKSYVLNNFWEFNLKSNEW